MITLQKTKTKTGREKMTIDFNGESMSIKKAVMKLNEWTAEEYTKAYKVFANRVKNYNRVAGTDLSASEQFFYNQKFNQKRLIAESKGQPIPEYNSIQSAIMNMTSATPKQLNQRAIDVVSMQLSERFKGLANANATGKAIQTAFENGTITPAQYRDQMGKLAELMHDYRDGKAIPGNPNPTGTDYVNDEIIGSP